MTAPRPGWYPDPAGAAELYRWWDGQQWTLAISESPQAPAPSNHPPVGLTELDGVPELAGVDRQSGPPRRRSVLRAAVAVTVGFAMFVSAGLGLGLVIFGEDPSRSRAGQLPTPPATLPSTPTQPAASGSPAGQLDDSTRMARIDRASMQLPPLPYRLNPKPMELPGVFDVMFSADADVHRRYNGGRNWTASVALAHLSPAMTSGHDLERSGSAAIKAIAQHFFGGHRTTVSNPAVWDRAVDGHPGLVFSVRANYSISKLPSRYDEVTVLLVRLDDGSMVAALSSVPDDADAALKELARTSLDSLTIS